MIYKVFCWVLLGYRMRKIDVIRKDGNGLFEVEEGR